MTTFYFSPSARGFYSSKVHKVIPDDAVELSEAQYRALLDRQARGKRIVAGKDGAPTVADARPGVAIS